MNFRDLIKSTEQTRTHSSVKPQHIGSLTEARFSEKNIEKVVKLYSKLMGKRMGGTFKPMGFESFKRSRGPGKGLRMMNNTGTMLRFNWDSKLAKNATYELTSLDYWAANNTNFELPTRSIQFASDLNVIQVLDKITDALLTGNLRESKKFISEANVLLEARSTKEKREWMIQNALPKSNTGEKDMRSQVQKKAPQLAEQLEVFLGSKETNTFEETLQDVQDDFNSQVYADPETIFDDIEDLLGLVASSAWKTLIICGQGGIGKTYHVTEGPRSLPKILGPEGVNWTYHSGTKASPLAFYKVLFQERDKVIVFDEADALLKHSEIVMMLKPILDTSGKNQAEYLTGTMNMVGKSDDEIARYSEGVELAIQQGATVVKNKSKRLWNPLMDEDLEPDMSEYDVMLPSKFVFSGGMIFISNMKSEQIEQAIMSRSIFIDVYLAESDVLRRIQTIGYAMAKGNNSVTTDRVDEVLSALGETGSAPEHKINYMTPEYARKSKQVTVRALQLGLILQESGLSRWKELAALYA